MKILYIFACLMLFASSAYARIDVVFDSKNNVACYDKVHTVNTPYKIHLLDEPITDSSVYLFTIKTQQGVIPTMKLITSIAYTDNAHIFKDRHGQALPLSEQVGVYIQFDNGVEEEITENPISLIMTNDGNNTYGGKILYRLKRNAREFANGQVTLTSRFEMHCKAV